MAFVANDSNKQFFSETKLFTGVSPMKIVGICPTLEELNELKFNFEKEPVYVSKDETTGTDKVRIDVVFMNDKVKSKSAFFLENRERQSKAGDKFEIINNFGQSTWAPSVGDALEKVGKNGKKWFRPEGARVALVGEVALISFLRDWLNANPEDQGKIDSYPALFAGNFKELQNFVKILSKNTIYTLSTVREGKYQGVYNGFFVRGQFTLEGAKTKFSNYAKAQKDSGYPIKDAYSFAFQPYTGGVVEPDAETAVKEQADDLKF